MVRMSPERWQVVRRALEELLELPADERNGWIEARAAGDAELACELQAILALHGDPENAEFLQQKLPSALNELVIGNLKGTRLGSYELDSLIGEGGMGTVWSAMRGDGHFDGRVAIKLLNTAIRAPEAAHRFMREGRLLAKLSHPNIARLLDAGVSREGTPYLVLEYVDGAPIDAYCHEQRLDIEARIRLFLQVLAAVEHSHSHLIVHRDIKPTNVLVTADGVPKLLDFGIARLADVDTADALAPAARTQTLWGARAMTLQFAAPEQLQGQVTTTRSDVYGLGVLLYLLLTGRHPTGLAQVPAAAYVAPTIEGKLVKPELPGDLSRVLLKALKNDPAQRYSSATEFAHDLQRVLEHRPVMARPDSLRYRTSKFLRRNRVATAACAVALSAVIAAGAVAFDNARAARFEADRAAAVHEFVRDMFGVGRLPAQETIALRSTTVEQLLDEGTRKLHDSRQWSPEVRVDLLRTLADMYLSVGQPAKAMPLLEESIELLPRLATSGALRDELQLAETWVKLAQAAESAGVSEKSGLALDRAEPLVRKLRAAAPRLFGQWSHETAARRAGSDSVVAIAAAREAAIAFAAAGDRVEQARSLCLLAFLLSRDARHTEAHVAMQDAMRLVDNIQPPNKELLMYVLAVGADLDYQMLLLRSSETKARQGLRVVIESKGVNHPMASRAHMRVALALWRQGKLQECVTVAQAGVAAVETSAGLNDQRVLPQNLQILGRCLAESGRPDEGIALLERALRLWDPAASGGVSIGMTYGEIMRAQLLRGDVARAERAHAKMLTSMSGKAAERRALYLAVRSSELRLAQRRYAAAVRELEPHIATIAADRPVGWDGASFHRAWARALTAAADPRAPQAVLAARAFFEGSALAQDAPQLLPPFMDLATQPARFSPLD